jgi:hypothetical protein
MAQMMAHTLVKQSLSFGLCHYSQFITLCRRVVNLIKYPLVPG